MDSPQLFTAKEVKSKLETVKFLPIQGRAPPSVSVPRSPAPLFDNSQPTIQNLYESPHIIDTDVDQILMVWPMCEGRDVNVSIKEDQLALEVRLAPLAKNSQQYLVEANCDAGALAKGLKSPPLEEFRFPLPKDVLPGGKHKLIEDPSEQYFGIRMQKMAEFKQKALVTSERSKEKKRMEMAEEQVKKKIATQILDEEAQYLYCQKLMQEIADKRKAKEGEIEEMAVEVDPDPVVPDGDIVVPDLV